MTRKPGKPILCLDFDGVLHGYQSGWRGVATIPDPPVPGALEFLVRALDRFDVCVLSSRSHQWGGRAAMKRWLKTHLIALGRAEPEDVPSWWASYIFAQSAMEPWEHEVRAAASRVVAQVRWPIFKPPALVTIDDRALTFTGVWPALDALAEFEPWTKRRQQTGSEP